MCCIKGSVRYIFASLKEKESTSETKMSFISLQKLFSFTIKSNFRILDTQILWRHQMPKYKTRNTFYWVTLEGNIICKWNLGSLFYIRKEQKLSKNSIKTVTWKPVPGALLHFKRIRHNLLWKIIFLKQAIDIRYVIAKLSKFVQIKFAHWPPQIPFYRGFF